MRCGTIMILTLALLVQRDLCAADQSTSMATHPAGEPQYLEARSSRAWSFPRDHGRHDGFKTEWWYFTGNLRGANGQRFGYQLTFFRTALAPAAVARPSPWAATDLYFAHAAISDIDANRFLVGDRLERGRAGIAVASDRTLDVSLLDWSARAEPDGIHLRAHHKDLDIDLRCTGGTGPVLQGPGGVNTKGPEPGQASYYYSMTRLQTTGRLAISGTSFDVTGQSWMDHEFSSNALGKQQVGWDWMGLQMDDGTGLMIYRLRDASGASDYLSGTRIGSDGTPHYLTADEIQLASSRSWKSPRTGGSYPREWKVKIAGTAPLTVRTLMPNQELTTENSTKVNYYEGAAQVLDEAGKEVGAGYLEMTGYAKSLNGSF